VVDAIADADLIVACPSNPVTSLGPILAVPGVTAALGRARAGVVAVSPIVGGAPVSGPAGRLMQARGLEVSPLGVAAAYTPWLRTLLIDERDRAAAPVLERAGVRAVVADVLMTDHAREVALARRVLQAAG
jgi:LPPG:FO 2-phospho-L-lactate transferase